ALAVVLIVTHNLTSNVDGTLSRWLTSMAADRAGISRGYPGPAGAPRFQAPVLWWMYHPDGNYDDSSAEAQGINLPVSPQSIKDPQTITVSRTDLRSRAIPTGTSTPSRRSTSKASACATWSTSYSGSHGSRPCPARAKLSPSMWGSWRSRRWTVLAPLPKPSISGSPSA